MYLRKYAAYLGCCLNFPFSHRYCFQLSMHDTIRKNGYNGLHSSHFNRSHAFKPTDLELFCLTMHMLFPVFWFPAKRLEATKKAWENLNGKQM